MSPLAIRAAISSDVPVLLALVRELAQYEKLAHEVTADAALFTENLFGAVPAAYALLAEVDGRAVGFCTYFFNFSTFLGRPGLYIEDIFVREAHRGCGIARQFFAELASIAEVRGCDRMEWAVLDWNRPAIDFYTRLGAYPKDEWTLYRLKYDRFAAWQDNGQPSRATAMKMSQTAS